jgi:O-acetyl-ADP-ribose deacetylase (regulator of RNase III)
VEHNLTSISFPSLSTGAFCYPMSLAAPIAMQAILQFLEHEQHNLKLVRMVLYSSEDKEAYSIYSQALQRLLLEGKSTTENE